MGTDSLTWRPSAGTPETAVTWVGHYDDGELGGKVLHVRGLEETDPGYWIGLWIVPLDPNVQGRRHRPPNGVDERTVGSFDHPEPAMAEVDTRIAKYGRVRA